MNLNQEFKINIVDIGAKFGIHPSFRKSFDFSEFLLIDADAEEIEYLRSLYQKRNNVNFLSEFSQRGGKFADMAGFVRYNEDGEEVLSFGKYRDVSLKQIWNENPGYFSWIQNADFPLYTKNVMKNFVDKIRLENKFNS